MLKTNPTFFKKKWIFGHFCDFQKCVKMAKNPFFLEKSGNFFWHSLIIWENGTFSFSTLFISIKAKPKKTLFFVFFLDKNFHGSQLWGAKNPWNTDFGEKLHISKIVTFDLKKIFYYDDFCMSVTVLGTFWPLKAKNWGKMEKKFRKKVELSIFDWFSWRV